METVNTDKYFETDILRHELKSLDLVLLILYKITVNVK